jgi:hypothetical protein
VLVLLVLKLCWCLLVLMLRLCWCFVVVVGVGTVPGPDVVLVRVLLVLGFNTNTAPPTTQVLYQD